MKLHKYEDFITESKLQLIFEELMLTMSNDFSNILVSMVNSIAGLLLSDRNEDNDKIRITDFDVHPTENDKVLFDGGKQSIYIGRLATAYLKSIGIDVKNHDFIKEETLEDFVNKYKAGWDSLHTPVNFEVISGDEIKWAFNANNYLTLDKGTLAKSCMRYADKQDYFDIYTKNSACQMLVQTENSKVKGRAILWKAKIFKTVASIKTSKDILFMDRIYTNNDSDVILFTKWANDNGYHYKIDQDNSEDGDIMFNGSPAYESGDYTMYVTLDKGFSTRKWPYMDTLKYYYRDDQQDIIANVEESYSTLGEIKFKMEETDGTNSNSCTECDATGFVECEDCDWRGNMDCPTCNGEGEINGEPCEDCAGDGEVVCFRCGGEKEIPCVKCNFNG